MKAPSYVTLLIDGEDVTGKCLWESCRFRSVANAIPGDFEIALRDDAHDYTPRSGAQVTLSIDGQTLFGGYLKRRGMAHWFPVHDTTVDPLSLPRKWILAGPDANVLFDKRVVHDTGNKITPDGDNYDQAPDAPNYLKRLKEPGGPLHKMVQYFWRKYTDFVRWNEDSGGYDWEVADGDLRPLGIDYPAGLVVGQGKYVRDQMEDFAQYGGAVYYIDGDWSLHFENYKQSQSTWGLTDYLPFGKNQQWIGFRELTYDEDSLQMVTDALVWGGSALHQPGTDPEGDTPIGTVFVRWPRETPKDFKIPGTDAWTTRLDGSIGSDQNSIKVRSVDGIPPINTGKYLNLELRIDDETMFATERNGTTLKVIRGTNKTSHNDGAKVIHDYEAPVVVSKEKEQQALDRIDTYGRWQRAEVRPGQDMYLTKESVFLRASTIVAGPPGIDPATNIDSGLNVPQPTLRLSWFAHDVPTDANHLRVGDIMDFQFYTLGQSLSKPLVLSLPCRSLSIDFVSIPATNPDHEPLSHVRFTGEFGVSSTDSRYLWKYLRNRTAKSQEGVSGVIRVTVDNSTAADNGTPGAKGTFFPEESPNGSRTTFTLPSSYRAGSTQVYLNGLLQNLNIQYKEVDPGAGTIRFVVAPYADDDIRVVCVLGGAP